MKEHYDTLILFSFLLLSMLILSVCFTLNEFSKHESFQQCIKVYDHPDCLLIIDDNISKKIVLNR